MAEGNAAHLIRVSPLKPALRGARNWSTAQLRAASYSRKAFWRLTAGIAVLFLFVIFMGLWMGGVLPDLQRGVSDFKRDRLMAMGFVVESVDVVGEGRLDEASVRRALGARPGDYFFDLDTRAAQARVQSLPWVDHVVVRRLWPDRVVVQIVEKRPYALWQSGGEYRLVDADGDVIAQDEQIARYTAMDALPLVVGADATQTMSALDAGLASHPAIASRVTARVRVGARWDLHLAGGLTVQLPEVGERAALARLDALHARTRVLDREVAVLDLRLHDRIGVRPAAGSPA